MSLWVSVPVLLLEVACIAAMSWATRDPLLSTAARTRLVAALAFAAAVGCLVLVLAWWRGW